MSNLLKDASILLTPTAYDNGSMLSIKPTNGDGDFTFSRNGDASRVNSSGNIVIEGANLPRINYENGCGSWLLEPESTNIIPYSTDFSTWAFGSDGFPNNMTRVDGQSSPDGGTNSSLYTRNSGTNGFFGYGNSTVVLGNTYTYSIFIKKGTSSTFQISNVANSPQSKVTYNIDTDTFTQEVNASGKSFNYGNDWYRLSMTYEHTNTSITFSQIRNILGDGESMYVFGAQFEEQSFATSYIPTQGASSTRLRDIATGSGNSTLINSTEGTLYAEIAALADDGTNRAISINNGSLTDYLFFRYKNNNQFQIIFRSGNNNIVNEIFTLSNNLDFNKIAFSYKLNEFKTFVNGLQIGSTITSGVVFGTAINSLDFDEFNGSNKFFGKTKAIAVFKEALTDAQLKALTTI